VGAAVGVVGAIAMTVLFLGVLNNIPDYLWHRLPPVVWANFSPWVLMFCVSAVYTIPICGMLGALLRFLITASRKS
jgi:hypothetical protein